MYINNKLVEPCGDSERIKIIKIKEYNITNYHNVPDFAPNVTDCKTVSRHMNGCVNNLLSAID